MNNKRWLRLLVVGLVAFSTVATSVGGAFASAASAAAPEEETGQISDGGDAGNKAVIGGVLALGLIAVLAKGGSGGDGSPDPGKASAPTAPSVAQPKPQPVLQPKPAPAPQPKPAPAPQPKPAPAPQPKPAPAPSGLSADEQKAYELLNADRAAQGLPPLRFNAKIAGLARNYAQDMINRGFFSHYNPEGQSPFDRMKAYGIKYGYAGENLAINTSVAGAERALMNSAGHRANILNSRYTQVGIGVRYDSKGSVYVVQEFTDG